MKRTGDQLPLMAHIEAEEALLGSCLLDPAQVDEVASLITPDSFFRDAHGQLFRALVELREKGAPIDVAVVVDHLGAVHYSGLGGDELMERITGCVPHGANAKYYAGIVRQKEMVRSLVASADETDREIRSCEFTASELLERAEGRLFAIAEKDAVGATADAKTIVNEAMARIERRQAGEMVGLATGFSELDRAIGGMQPGTLTVVGARPSMGKTALCFGIAAHRAAAGEPVLFVSLEMGRLELGDRLLSYFSGLSSDQILHSHGDADRLRSLSVAYKQVNAMPLQVDDTASRAVSQIAANARRLKRRQGLSLVVIDYLSLIDGQRQRGESRQEEVARISRRLKAMARELATPVLVAHQLNRLAESREGHRPRLADLRESGQVEQDADCVILLHRPDYYKKDDRPGEADLILAKNRNGPCGIVRLTFRKEIMRFYSYASENEP